MEIHVCQPKNPIKLYEPYYMAHVDIGRELGHRRYDTL